MADWMSLLASDTTWANKVRVLRVGVDRYVRLDEDAISRLREPLRLLVHRLPLREAVAVADVPWSFFYPHLLQSDLARALVLLGDAFGWWSVEIPPADAHLWSTDAPHIRKGSYSVPDEAEENAAPGGWGSLTARPPAGTKLRRVPHASGWCACCGDPFYVGEAPPGGLRRSGTEELLCEVCAMECSRKECTRTHRAPEDARAHPPDPRESLLEKQKVAARRMDESPGGELRTRDLTPDEDVWDPLQPMEAPSALEGGRLAWPGSGSIGSDGSDGSDMTDVQQLGETADVALKALRGGVATRGLRGGRRRK